MLEHFQE